MDPFKAPLLRLLGRVANLHVEIFGSIEAFEAFLIGFPKIACDNYRQTVEWV